MKFGLSLSPAVQPLVLHIQEEMLPLTRKHDLQETATGIYSMGLFSPKAGGLEFEVCHSGGAHMRGLSYLRKDPFLLLPRIIRAWRSQDLLTKIL